MCGLSVPVRSQVTTLILSLCFKSTLQYPDVKLLGRLAFIYIVQFKMLYNGVRKYLLEGDSLPEVEAGCGGGGGLLLHRRQVLPARQLRIGGRPECTLYR